MNYSKVEERDGDGDEGEGYLIRRTSCLGDRCIGGRRTVAPVVSDCVVNKRWGIKARRVF